MSHETHHHCQCDFCDGVDCGQDNPEEYEAEQERIRQEIRAAGVKEGREQGRNGAIDDAIEILINRLDDPFGVEELLNSIRQQQPKKEGVRIRNDHGKTI